MNLRNDEPFGLLGYPPEVLRFPKNLHKPNKPVCPLGASFEALTSHFERCSEAHGGCENCQGRVNGCMSLFETVCTLGASRKLSRRQMEPQVLEMLHKVGGYDGPPPETPRPQNFGMMTPAQGLRQIIQENTTVSRRSPVSRG